MSVLVFAPSRNRPQQAAQALASFEATRRDKKSRLVFVVDRDDVSLKDYPREHTYVVEPAGCMGAAIQKAGSDQKLLADATSVGFIGDDNRFRTKGWDTALDGWLTQNIGIAYADDGFQHERLPTAWWLSRPIVDEFGLALPILKHLYMDNYWQEMGQGAKCLRYFPDLLIEHLHPIAGKAPQDAIYARGNSPEFIDHDKRAFEYWRGKDRPGDVARLRQIIDYQKNGINMLADYHHAALFESLALLFEDRFGWNLYRPIGPEWKAENYWGFENPAMELSSKEFLRVGENDTFVGSHYLIHNDPYPNRDMKGVTLYQARSMDWDYVLGSVPANQHGFSQFANEQGARFIQQVGNATHHIDQNIPAVYLISAKEDLGGRAGVVYHQEFDTKMFRYRPPTPTRIIANFTLRFDWTECYPLFLRSKKLAHDFTWQDFSSMYGKIITQSEVAEKMQAASFIWHDKPIGDGYGHAIHNAAAVGRPLIGHGKHYRGRMAEIFWRDLETCIDLDNHSLEETIDIIRDISAHPKRHRAMCEAMYETFRAAVDFDKDATEVKSLLAGPLSGEFYDESYFGGRLKSSYRNYGPGSWAGALACMIGQYLKPSDVLDVGCAYGFVVDQLEKVLVPATGFDISPFAVSQASSNHVWVGSSDRPASYRQCDLLLGAEFVSHLNSKQAATFFRLGLKFAKRMLLLITTDGNPYSDGSKPAVDNNDLSNLNLRPMWWWHDLAQQCGWEIGDAADFNNDQRSLSMGWGNRFMLLERPKHT